ncbi:gliding motility-associated C-terminal domain-containing protein [bacterium]|nr:gliding motility-associated C-terminal domain-containing protein [bacterium]
MLIILGTKSLVDNLIEQNELFSVNSTLTQIHKTTVRRKRIAKGLIIASLAGIAIAGAVLISNIDNTKDKIVLATETNKAEDFIVEATPYKVIDSMSEVELNSAIKESRIALETIIETDSIIHVEPKNTPSAILLKKDSVIKPIQVLPTKIDSVFQKPQTTNRDSLNVRKPCEIKLTTEDVDLTSTCQEKRSGAILFTNTESDYLYSINNQESYTKNPLSNYLEKGRYLISIKKDQCESEPIEITIEGYQCNYVIDPANLIFFEKSLIKFQKENTVEVFIFNRYGVMVYTKTLPTTENFTWEGSANNSTQAPMGNYTYLIKSGQKIAKGEITVIR